MQPPYQPMEIVAPEIEIDRLDEEDINEILDALDDGKNVYETQEFFKDQGLNISIEALEILEKDLGREAAQLTDDKRDEINEQYMKGASTTDIARMLNLRKSTIDRSIDQFTS